MIRPRVTLARPRPPARAVSSVGRPTLAPSFPATPFAVTGSPVMSFYPAVLDSTPALVDGQSPMVAQWLNLLQSVVEAVEAAIGPLPPNMVRNHMPGGPQRVDSLLKLLGQQTVLSGTSTLSYAALCTAVAGNNRPAGTLYGIQRVQVSRSSWTTTTDYTATISNPFGIPPRFKRPIAWGYPRQRPGTSMQNMFDFGPAKVVASVDSINVSGVNVNNNLKWAACTCVAFSNASLTPTNGPSYTMDLCIMYLCTEDDA